MRLADHEYYQDRPVAHTAQGDLYAQIPFVTASAAQGDFESRGARKRPGFTGDFVTGSLEAVGVVCSYTCGFMAQPPGTPGYAHDIRLVAPLLPLRHLKELGMSTKELRGIRDDGGRQGFMYLPIPADSEEEDDEWRGHGAACLYRPASVTQSLLDSRTRVAQMSEAAQRILIVRLIQTVSPNNFDPFDENLRPPDLSDSWASL